jgi:hypothetical protein
MPLNVVLARRLVLVSPKTTLPVPTFGGPFQMRRFKPVSVEVVVDPV